MKYLTFNQVLLAVGLIGLALALVSGEGNSFAIAASLLVEDGPSIGGPAILQAVALALPLAILAIALARSGSPAASGDPVTYAEVRLAIALAGLVLLASLTPQLITANATAGWDESIASFIYLGVTLVILAAMLGHALGARMQDTGPFGVPQVLVCVGLIALVIAAVFAPITNGILVGGRTDAPDFIVISNPLAFHIYGIAAVGVILVVLLIVRVRGGMGLRSAVVTTVLLVGISASVNLVYALTLGLPLAVLVIIGYLGGRAESGTPGPVRTGPLLVTLGLLSLVMGASTTTYVIGLYHACAKFDASLYLWPTLALVAALVFGLGVLATGLRRLRAVPEADDTPGE